MRFIYDERSIAAEQHTCTSTSSACQVWGVGGCFHAGGVPICVCVCRVGMCVRVRQQHESRSRVTDGPGAL